MSLLDEIVRDGARQMLAAALQDEVASCIASHAAREVTTAAGAAAGAVPVRQPQVNNTPHLVALVRAGAVFEKGKLVERPDESGGDQQVA